MTTTTLTKADLAQFTGTEFWYRHPLVRKLTFTDGVKYVADTAGAYWLVDEIAFAQQFEPKVASQPFQYWQLKVDLTDNTALLTCEDGNGKKLLGKEIPFTDFPLEEIAFYVTNNVILLTSEY